MYIYLYMTIVCFIYIIITYVAFNIIIILIEDKGTGKAEEGQDTYGEGGSRERVCCLLVLI